MKKSCFSAGRRCTLSFLTRFRQKQRRPVQPWAAGQAEEQWGGKIKGAARVSAAQDGSPNRIRSHIGSGRTESHVPGGLVCFTRRRKLESKSQQNGSEHVWIERERSVLPSEVSERQLQQPPGCSQITSPVSTHFPSRSDVGWGKTGKPPQKKKLLAAPALKVGVNLNYGMHSSQPERSQREEGQTRTRSGCFLRFLPCDHRWQLNVPSLLSANRRSGEAANQPLMSGTLARSSIPINLNTRAKGGGV